MSYILEALKKIESQKAIKKRHESFSEIIRQTLPDDQERNIFNTKYIFIVSVLFGVLGLFSCIYIIIFSFNTKNNPTLTIVEDKKTIDNYKKDQGLNQTESLNNNNLKNNNNAKINIKGINLSNIELKKKPLNQSFLPKKEEKNTIIDLTNDYKLTSIGEENNIKFVTIDGNTYKINEVFMNMTITKIGQDRVWLKDNNNSFVIIFRYKKE